MKRLLVLLLLLSGAFACAVSAPTLVDAVPHMINSLKDKPDNWCAMSSPCGHSVDNFQTKYGEYMGVEPVGLKWSNQGYYEEYYVLYDCNRGNDVPGGYDYGVGPMPSREVVSEATGVPLEHIVYRTWIPLDDVRYVPAYVLKCGDDFVVMNSWSTCWGYYIPPLQLIDGVRVNKLFPLFAAVAFVLVAIPAVIWLMLRDRKKKALSTP